MDLLDQIHTEDVRLMLLRGWEAVPVCVSLAVWRATVESFQWA